MKVKVGVRVGTQIRHYEVPWDDLSAEGITQLQQIVWDELSHEQRRFRVSPVLVVINGGKNANQTAA